MPVIDQGPISSLISFITRHWHARCISFIAALYFRLYFSSFRAGYEDIEGNFNPGYWFSALKHCHSVTISGVLALDLKISKVISILDSLNTGCSHFSFDWMTPPLITGWCNIYIWVSSWVQHVLLGRHPRCHAPLEPGRGRRVSLQWGSRRTYLERK